MSDVWTPIGSQVSDEEQWDPIGTSKADDFEPIGTSLDEEEPAVEVAPTKPSGAEFLREKGFEIPATVDEADKNRIFLEDIGFETPMPEGLRNPEVQNQLQYARGLLGEDEAADLESSFYLADMFGMPTTEAYEQLGAYAKLADVEPGRPFGQLVKDEWSRGRYNVTMSQIMSNQALAAMAGDNEGVTDAMTQIEELSKDMPPAIAEGEASFLPRILAKGVGLLPFQLQAEYESVAPGLVGAGVATAAYAAGAAGTVAVVSAAGGPVLSAGATVAGGVAAATSGYLMARKAGKIISMSKMMLGQFMMRQIQEGADPQVAAWVGLPISGLQGVIEQLQASKILNLIPGKARGLGHILQTATDKFMGPGGAGAKVVKGLMRGIGTYTQEMAEEVAQGLADDFGDDIVATAEQYLLGKDVEYNTVQDILRGITETIDQAKEPLLGMMLGPAMMGTMVDLFTPEVQAQMEVDAEQRATAEPEAPVAPDVEKVVPEAEELVAPAPIEPESIPIDEQITDETPPERAQIIATEELQSDIDAGGFASAEELVAFAHTMYDEDNLPADDVLWEMYESQAVEAPEPVTTVETPARSLQESNDEFIAAVSTRESMENLLGDMGVFIDSEIGKLRDAGASLSEARGTLGNIWDRSVFANAQRVKGGKQLTEVSFKSILGKIKKDPARFRLLLASMQNDVEEMQLLQAQMEEADIPIPETFPLAEAEQRAEAAIAEEEQAAAVLEGEEIEPERELLKTRVRRITGQTPINRIIAQEQLLKTRLAGEARGAKMGAKAQRELHRQQAVIKKEKDRIRGYREDIKKALKSTKKMDPVQKAELESLTEGIAMVGMRTDKVIRLEKTAEFLRNNPDHDMPDTVLDDLNRLHKSQWGWMTPDEAESLHHGVMTSMALSDQKQKLKVQKKQRDFDAAVGEFLPEIKTGGRVKRTFVGPKEPSGLSKAAHNAKNLVGISQSRPDVVIGQAFGNEGVGRDVFGRQIEEGMAADYAYRQNMFDEFQRRLIDNGFDVNQDTSKWVEKKVSVETESGEVRMERGQRIALYRHTLDPDNYESMLTGIGFRTDKNPNDIQQVTAEDIQKIVDSMDDDERAWAEASAPIFEQTGKDQQAEYYNQHGWEPPMRENYMKKDVMPVARAGGQDAESEAYMEQVNRQINRVGVDKRQLIERQDVRKPIYVNNIAQDLNEAIMRAAAYVNLEAPLKNAHKLLNDQRIKESLLSTPEGVDVSRYLQKYLRDVAGEHEVYTELTRFTQKLRTGVTKYALGGNLWVATKQALSYPFAAMNVKPKYLALGALDESFHPRKTKEMHEEYSARFRERRQGGYSRDIAEAMKKNTAGQRLLNDRKSFGQWLMSPSKAVDAKTVSGVMSGAVRQAMDEFEQGVLSKEVQTALGPDVKGEDVQKMTADEQLELAYNFADYASTRSQPQFSPDMLSQIQRSGEVGKLVSQFSSFTNQELNVLRRAMTDAKGGDYRKLAWFSASFVANAVGIFALDRARDEVRAKKEEDMKKLAGVFVDSLAGMYYGVRDVEKAVAGKVRGTYGQGDISLPIARVGEELVTAISSLVLAFDPNQSNMAKKRHWARFAESFLDLIMMRMGIPYVFKRAVETVTGKRIGELIEEMIP